MTCRYHWGLRAGGTRDRGVRRVGCSAVQCRPWDRRPSAVPEGYGERILCVKHASYS